MNTPKSLKIFTDDSKYVCNFFLIFYVCASIISLHWLSTNIGDNFLAKTCESYYHTGGQRFYITVTCSQQTALSI